MIIPKRRNIQQLPLMIYIGLKVHSINRNKKLIDILHHLRLYLPYKHVMSIHQRFGYAVIDQIRDEDLLCPRSLKKGILTVSAGDNIYHNSSSTTSINSFHGTTISMFQSSDTKACSGEMIN